MFYYDCLGLEIVSFQGFQLVGTLPQNIGLLPNLKELHVSETSITGSLSTEFGTLVSLTNLELFNNPMTGTIPTELGRLNALRKLSLLYPCVFSVSQDETFFFVRLTLFYFALINNFIKSSVEKFLLHDTKVTGMLPTELCNRPQLSIGIDCELLNPVCESECY